MKLLFASLLIFTTTSCDLKEYCWEVLTNNYIEVFTDNERADQFAQDMLNAYYENGEEGVDFMLSTADDDWYAGMDLYIGDDYQTLVDAFENDEEAHYHHTKKATIAVAFDGITYVLIILSDTTL